MPRRSRKKKARDIRPAPRRETASAEIKDLSSQREEQEGSVPDRSTPPPSSVDSGEFKGSQGAEERIPAWLRIGSWVCLAGAVFWIAIRSSGFAANVFRAGETKAKIQSYVQTFQQANPLLEGQRLYRIHCAVCHQTDGQGVPGQFPPLRQSEWVLDPDPSRLIRIVLGGLEGEITVKGQRYNNIMLPLGDRLTDEEIARILTFIRKNPEWGHHAEPVHTNEVRTLRRQQQGRRAYWTEKELGRPTSSF